MPKRECKCGTGEYCHVHQKYQSPKTTESYSGETRDEYEDIIRTTAFRQCGGGRQVIRRNVDRHN